MSGGLGRIMTTLKQWNGPFGATMFAFTESFWISQIKFDIERGEPAVVQRVVQLAVRYKENFLIRVEELGHILFYIVYRWDFFCSSGTPFSRGRS